VEDCAFRARIGLKPLTLDPEQVLAARLKCNQDSALTPSPLVAVEVGKLLRRSTEIGEQTPYRGRALNAQLRGGKAAATGRA
jgi:hypothetical protein